MDGDTPLARRTRRKFGRIISDKKLALSNTFVTTENITQLFSQMDIPREFDLLSIDIDGNDY
jgi:hypothetical protein